MTAAEREGTEYPLDNVPDTLIERYRAAPRGWETLPLPGLDEEAPPRAPRPPALWCWRCRCRLKAGEITRYQEDGHKLCAHDRRAWGL